VPAARFSPAGATVGSGGISLGDAASATLDALARERLGRRGVRPEGTRSTSARSTIRTGAAGTFEWDPSPLVIEDWSQPEPFETHGGAPRTGLSYHTRAFARTTGRIRLNPTSQLVNLSVGVTGFGFFQQRQYQQFAVPDGPATRSRCVPCPRPRRIHGRGRRLQGRLEGRAGPREGRAIRSLGPSSCRARATGPRSGDCPPARPRRTSR
jgi:hypothetical protein